MKRILVIGSGGAGKSTFSTKLGTKLGLPVFHLDSLYWKAGWLQPTQEEFAQTLKGLIGQDQWIIDGNYSATLTLRIAACDTLIFLDRTRFLCLWRILLRRLRFHGRTRPDMSEGCHEQVTLEFIRYVWSYPSTRRHRILARLAELRNEKTIVVLRSDKQVEAYLADIEQA